MVCNYSNTLAIKYGINAALIAGYINYRLKNSDIFAECCFWIKISHKSLTAVFPFMGEKAVRNAIEKLKKANVISVKQLEKEQFDHTNFYSLTTYGKTIINGDGDTE